MEISEIREMSVEELKEKEREIRKRLFELRLALRESSASLREYRELRKTLARILTVLRIKSLSSSEPSRGNKRSHR
jgi:large subunit ribosomal protein L29